MNNNIKQIHIFSVKNVLLHYYVMVEKYKLPNFTFLSLTYPIANVRQGRNKWRNLQECVFQVIFQSFPTPSKSLRSDLLSVSRSVRYVNVNFFLQYFAVICYYKNRKNGFVYEKLLL